MPYTVRQLARLANISARTLHHYHAIGLLKPSFIAKNGYRQYEEPELIRLQQILFFRELDFPLADIKRMLERADFDEKQALADHKKLLKLKRARLDGLIKTIDKTVNTMTSNKKIVDDELYDAFKDEDIKHYQEEVKQRWGHSDAYKQSMARVSKMPKKEMDKLKTDGKAFTKQLADSMDKGPRHPDVQALIAKHHDGIKFFYDCPLEMYRNLGQMYVDDPRFTAYYDKFRPGLAAFVRDAIVVYCEARRGKRSA